MAGLAPVAVAKCFDRGCAELFDELVGEVLYRCAVEDFGPNGLYQHIRLAVCWGPKSS